MIRFARQLSPRALVALATGGSAAVLAGALLFQWAGYAPCDLCILQRWPHLAAVAIGVAILMLRLPMPSALAGAVVAVLSAGLGVYHSGVERHIFAGPDSCTSNPLSANLSPAELLAQISQTPLVRCDEIPWEIFGITMANLNALGSAGLAVLWLWAVLKAQRGA